MSSEFQVDWGNPENVAAQNEANNRIRNPVKPMSLGNDRIRFRAGMAGSAMQNSLGSVGMNRTAPPPPGLMGQASQRFQPGMNVPTMGPAVKMGLNGGYGPNQYGGTGVVSNPNQAPPQNAVQQARQQGPDLAAIQAEMARRKVGAALGPKNAALAGSVMG